MKYFNLPADFKKETIDRYDQLNQSSEDSRVVETYGNITAGLFLGSGRSIEQLPEVVLRDLQEYVEYSRRKKIDFNYTINPSHMKNQEFTEKGILEIMVFLGKLYDSGIRSLTIALPSLMEIINASKYEFKVKASVICQITNTEKALAYKDLGVERIVVDEALNRDFHTLKRMRDAFGDKIEIIINTICHKNCMYRMFHYNQISTDSLGITNEASANYYSHRCILQRYKNPANLLRLSWVRPEELKYYTGIGIQYFKLQGRQAVLKGDPVKAVEYYFKESYDGNLLDLLDLFSPTSQFRLSIDNRRLDGFLKPFYENENFCKNNCGNCHYCETFAKKCIDSKEVEMVYKMAREFYKDFDGFNRLLDSSTREKSSNEPPAVENVDFDLG